LFMAGESDAHGNTVRSARYCTGNTLTFSHDFRVYSHGASVVPSLYLENLWGTCEENSTKALRRERLSANLMASEHKNRRTERFVFVPLHRGV
jgi:hypothetical protein